MEIEGIYLHGGVKGFSFINDRATQTEYDSFFRRFYDKITKAAVTLKKIESVSKSFVIESLLINGKQFYDYTFLEYYVFDVSGRPSYFGITIRLNAFYCEVSDLYFILDTIFKKDFIGNLLLPRDSTYMCTKEEIDKPLFESTMNDFVQLSSSVLQDSKLKSLRSVSSEHGDSICLNLIDCQPMVVEKAITQYGKLIITTDAPLQRESQGKQEIDKLNKQWTVKWEELQGRYTDAINNAKGLNNTIQTLRGQLSQIQEELHKVNREFEEYKSNNKLSYQVINGLKEEKQALLKLADFVDSLSVVEQHRTHGNQRNNNLISFSIRSYLSFIISIIVIGLILWGVFSLNDCSGKNMLSPSYGDQANNAQIAKQSSNPNNAGDIIHKDSIPQADGDSPYQDDAVSGKTDINTKTVDFNSLTIDVAEFNKDVKYMVKNCAYTIRILDKKESKPVEGIVGSWNVKESDFYIGNLNSAETSITPKRSGDNLEIRFFVNGYDTPLMRTIIVR